MEKSDHRCRSIPEYGRATLCIFLTFRQPSMRDSEPLPVKCVGHLDNDRIHGGQTDITRCNSKRPSWCRPQQQQQPLQSPSASDAPSQARGVNAVYDGEAHTNLRITFAPASAGGGPRPRRATEAAAVGTSIGQHWTTGVAGLRREFTSSATRRRNKLASDIAKRCCASWTTREETRGGGRETEGVMSPGAMRAHKPRLLSRSNSNSGKKHDTCTTLRRRRTHRCLILWSPQDTIVEMNLCLLLSFWRCTDTMDDSRLCALPSRYRRRSFA
jgi:hypothetical protein